MAAPFATPLTAHGRDAHPELSPCSVMPDTTSTLSVITVPFAAAFTPLGSTATVIPSPLRAKLDTILTPATTVAFAVEFTPHGKLAVVTLFHLLANPPITSMLLETTVPFAQESQADSQ